MKTLFLSVAALLAVGATPAAAQPGAQSVAVHYGDLDLGSARGRAILDHRLRQAVRTACGDPSPSDLRGMNRAGDCREALTQSLNDRRDAIYAAAAMQRPPVLVAAR